jgi:hypothetical protein
MSNKVLPFTAWILTPSLKPAEVSIELDRVSWFQTSRGKYVMKSDVFDSQAEAIKAGWVSLKRQKSDIDKKLENIEKKKLALLRAEKSMAQEAK